MTHGRKPRTPRTRVHAPLRIASWGAAMLDTGQQQNIVVPVRAAFKALREGVATELQWMHVVSAMNIADSVAITTRDRGLRPHIAAAQHALEGIRARAMHNGEWKPSALYFDELDHVRDGVDIYAEQLRVITRGEYQAAEKHALADMRSSSAGACMVFAKQDPAGEQLALIGD